MKDLPGADDLNDYEGAKEALHRHFDPQLNPDYELFKFRQAVQAEGETIDTFYGRLRRMVSTCEVAYNDFEVRAQIIRGCRSVEFRKLIMLQPRIPLNALLVLGRSHKLADVRANVMAGVMDKRGPPPKYPEAAPIKTETACAASGVPEGMERGPVGRGRGRKCQYCGREPHPIEGCPARGRQCSKCGKYGHFAGVCRYGGVYGPGGW